MFVPRSGEVPAEVTTVLTDQRTLVFVLAHAGRADAARPRHGQAGRREPHPHRRRRPRWPTRRSGRRTPRCSSPRARSARSCTSSSRGPSAQEPVRQARAYVRQRRRPARACRRRRRAASSARAPRPTRPRPSRRRARAGGAGGSCCSSGWSSCSRPAAAYVFGVRATEIENRRLTPFPSLSAGWEFFPQVSAWATDHLPLRDRAVAANTGCRSRCSASRRSTAVPPRAARPGRWRPRPAGGRSQERVFPKVLQGQDGWLFLGADVCGAVRAAAAARRDARRARPLRRAGPRGRQDLRLHRRARQVDDEPRQDARDLRRRRLRARGQAGLLGADADDPPVGYVDLKARARAGAGARAARTSGGRPTPTGRSAARSSTRRSSPTRSTRRCGAPAASSPTGPDRAAGRPRRAARHAAHGRGARLAPASATACTVTERAGDHAAPRRPPARRCYTPPTLILGDSFTQSSLSLLSPLFASARIVQPATATDDPPALVSAVAVVRHDRARDRRALGRRRRRPDHRRGLPRRARAGARRRAARAADGRDDHDDPSGRGQRGRPAAVLPGRAGHRPRGVGRAAGAALHDRRELAVPQRHERRPEQRHVLPAGGVRRRRRRGARPGGAAPGARADGAAVRDDLAPGRRRRAAARRGHGQPVRPLPATTCCSATRSASCTSTSSRSSPTTPTCGRVADNYGVPFRHIPVTRETKPRPRPSCSSSCAPRGSSWSCSPATCRSCPTGCAASCAAGRSTSTTRCCRASRAPGPTTRPTTAG